LMASAIMLAQRPQQISDDFQIKKRNPRYYYNNNWLGTTGNTGSVLLWNGVAVAIGDPMVYPDAGIPLSTGAAWGGLNNDLSVNTWGIVRILFNGASSELIINGGSATTGDFGSDDMGGIILGAQQSGAGWGNVEFKEIIIRKIADTPTNETAILDYLNTKYTIY